MNYFDFFVSMLSKILFVIDPVGTMCKENDSFDEYDYTSGLILTEFYKNRDLVECVEEVFEFWHSRKLHPLYVTEIVNSYFQEQKEFLQK